MEDYKTIFKECNDAAVYMIGRLRNDVDSSMKALVNHNIRFYVQPLCDDPKPIQCCRIIDKKPYYIGFDKNQNRDLLPRFYDQIEDAQARMEELQTFYADKLIVFYPRYTVNPDGTVFKNMDIYKHIPCDFEQDHYFDMIPCVQMKPKAFEQLLQNGKYFELPYYDGTLHPAPEFFLCGSYLYTFAQDHSEIFTCSETNGELWKCENSEDILCYDLHTCGNIEDHLFMIREEIGFLESNAAAALRDQYTGITLTEKAKLDEKKEEHQKWIDMETSFLEDFLRSAEFHNLFYEDQDLINLHTCVKTSSITLLYDPGNNGKTQLAMRYGAQLGATLEQHTLLLVPGSAAYRDASDVLGYLHPITNQYVPAPTGLVSFLIHAAQHPEELHVVVFEEMDLSQIEYWFAPFLSLMDQTQNREIRLYAASIDCVNQEQYPDTIAWKDNIIMLGTLSKNETAKALSDRFIDHVFLLPLHKQSLSEAASIPRYEPSQIQQINVSTFTQWKREAITSFSTKEYTECLDALDQLLSNYMIKSGIAYQTMQKIFQFIQNVPLTYDHKPMIDPKEAFDLAVNQTILPKIRGTRTQIQNLVGTYQNDTIDHSDLLSLLAGYEQLSSFTKTKASIEEKAKGLCYYGYIE